MASVSASDGLPHQPLCASDGLPHQVRDWEKPITAEDNCVFICVASALDPNAAPEGHHVHASPPARNQLCDDLFDDLCDDLCGDLYDDLFEADCENDCETD